MRLVLGASAVVAASASLATAGCGGGEDRLSTAEFEERVNGICTKYDKQIDAVRAPSSVEEIPAYVAKVLPIVEREVEEMKAVEPPEDDQETFDAMIGEAEKALEAGRDLSDAAEENDEAAIENALNEGNAASDRADEHARELGLTDCVNTDE
jgi:predicted  nucleic acid-binding Zn-ribbon protein